MAKKRSLPRISPKWELSVQGYVFHDRENVILRLDFFCYDLQKRREKDFKRKEMARQ
jgi:hypothetical protein